MSIESWPAGLRARYLALLIRMTEFGPDMGMPHTRAMGDGLFEVRAKAAEGIGRAFYCTLVGKRIVILHGFVKKTDKTPAKELKIARERLKELKR
jgi:phage-related protein